MYCAKCGKELEKDAKFCVNCGTAVNAKQGENETKKGDEGQTTPAVNSQNTNQNNKTNNNSFSYMNIPYEYKPISMWGYFGYEILFAIPCIGWILLLVFALGGTSNKNLQNFAASYFCILIILVIIIAILIGTGALGVFLYEIR